MRLDIAVFILTSTVTPMAVFIPTPPGVPPAAPPGLKILAVERTEHGLLTWYGSDHSVSSSLNGKAAASPELSAKLRKRCGSNQIECADVRDSPMALTLSCEYLLDDIKDKQSTQPTRPRSTCLTMDKYGTCCVTWSKDAPGARTGALYNAAKDIFNSSQPAGMEWFVAGKSRDTYINGTCLTECLSRAPDDCTDD